MHAWGRLLGSGAVCAALLVLLTVAPARADGTGDAWTDGKNVGAGASTTDGDSTSRPAGGGRSSKPVCTWVRLDPEHAAMADRMAENGTGATRGDGNGVWYRKICNEAGGSTATVVWVPERVDPRVLAERAADRVAIPAVQIGMNPRPEQGAVVNVETWLWVDASSWNSVTAQASAGNVVVTATASPRRVIWDMGNGDRVTCEGPGTAYDPSRPSSEQSTDCSYTYRKSSARAPGGAYTVTATVVWEVSWTVTGAAGGGSLGTAPRSQSVRLPVKEIQAVNR
jgi:hypothetical protein